MDYVQVAQDLSKYFGFRTTLAVGMDKCIFLENKAEISVEFFQAIENADLLSKEVQTDWIVLSLKKLTEASIILMKNMNSIDANLLNYFTGKVNAIDQYMLEKMSDLERHFTKKRFSVLPHSTESSANELRSKLREYIIGLKKIAKISEICVAVEDKQTEPKKGTIKTTNSDIPLWICNNCGRENYLETVYCPNCSGYIDEVAMRE